MNDRLSHVVTILRVTFGVVPIVAGLDKFANLLTDWTAYLSPTLAGMLPVGAPTFLHLVGVIEIAAGILVLAVPRVGAYVVSAWLVLIALNLLSTGAHLDVAVRDLVMAASAFCLARLCAIRQEAGARESLRQQPAHA